MFNDRPPWEPQFGQLGQPQTPQPIEESWVISYCDGKFDQPVMVISKQTSSGIFLENLLFGQAAVDAHTMLVGEQTPG